jgi:hypothetical protein
MIKSKLAKSAPRTLHLILTKRQEKKKKSTEAQKSSGCVDLLRRGGFNPKEFDLVHFRNGYSPTSPTMLVECKGIRFGYGKQKWGAVKGLKYFIIELGKIIQSSKQ